MPDFSSVLVTEPSIVFRKDMDNGGVLYNPDTDRAYSVNNLGASIWTMLQGGNTPEGVIGQVQALFPLPPVALRQDVLDFLDGLLQNKLIHEQ